MKQTALIVGQWYRITDGESSGVGNELWYGKFLEIDENNIIITSNHYSGNTGFHDRKGNFGKPGSYTFTKVELEEITPYLPKNHPDRIKPIVINDLSHIEPLKKLLENL